MRFVSADRPALFPAFVFGVNECRHCCRRKGSIVLLTGLWLWLTFVGLCLAADLGEKKKTTSIKVRLFGTVEFRSSLKVLPQWKRVMIATKRQVRHFGGCNDKKCSPTAVSWQRIIGQTRGKPPMAQLNAVNRFFNQWPYRLDIELYGVPDYWATPGEFMKMSGDCEDFSIAKYYALKNLGFDTQMLRIVVIRDRIRNIGHAVLAVYMLDTAFILDNLSNVVLEHGKYTHYIPQYSVNEKNRWSHVKPVKTSKKGF